MNKEILKNVIIFDGENTYRENEILSSKELLKYFSNCYDLHFPKSFESEVIKENGIFYLRTDKNLLETSITLKNVSQQLNDRFSEIHG